MFQLLEMFAVNICVCYWVHQPLEDDRGTAARPHWLQFPASVCCLVWSHRSDWTTSADVQYHIGNTQRANLVISIFSPLTLPQIFSLTKLPLAHSALASFVRENNECVKRQRRQDCCDGQNENTLILPKLMDAVCFCLNNWAESQRAALCIKCAQWCFLLQLTLFHVCIKWIVFYLISH